MSDEMEEEYDDYTEDKESFNDPFELLEESIKVKGDIKTTKKALKDVTKRLADEIHCDIGFVKEAQKMLAAEGKEKGDTLKDAFDKIVNIITIFNQVGLSAKLHPYFDKLNSMGINISLEEANNSPTPSIEEGFKDSTSYIRNIEEMQEEISKTHAPNSEDINFAPAKEYKGVLSIYERRLKGKDVDDDVQEKIAYCEMTEKAYNLVNDKII